MNDFKEQFGDEIDIITYALNFALSAKRLGIDYAGACYRLGLHIGHYAVRR